jgi:hypothetical protein
VEKPDVKSRNPSRERVLGDLGRKKPCYNRVTKIEKNFEIFDFYRKIEITFGDSGVGTIDQNVLASISEVPLW